ncbi:MAG: hypothetical protein ACN4GM_13830 [Gammaproteobacteria bacterium]
MMKPSRSLIVLLVCCVLTGISSPLRAWEYGGHFKYVFDHTKYPEASLGSSLGGERQTGQGINSRLLFSQHQDHWGFETHYELSALHSNSDSLQAIPDPDSRRWFDLSYVFENDSSDLILHRLDRLSLSYTSESLVMRLGRQAVTWGNGLVFHPMDIFNPFKPVTIDKDYKTGDDMLYGQWTTSGGNDWQMIVLPRRDETGELEQSQSSLALKYHGLAAEADIDIMLAQHYDQPLLGIGYSRAIGEALWRMDITQSRNDSDEGVTSFVTNVDYSWIWLGHNVYGYMEYYHNGFGQNDIGSALDAELQKRIERGELFVLGKNYLSAGMQIELHPLLSFSPSWIVNLHDHGGLLPLTLIYNWQQNLQLTLTGIISYGDRQSEYDGYYSTGDTLNFLLAYYF